MVCLEVFICIVIRTFPSAVMEKCIVDDTFWIEKVMETFYGEALGILWCSCSFCSRPLYMEKPLNTD